MGNARARCAPAYAFSSCRRGGPQKRLGSLRTCLRDAFAASTPNARVRFCAAEAAAIGREIASNFDGGTRERLESKGRPEKEILRQFGPNHIGGLVPGLRCAEMLSKYTFLT